MKAILLIDHGSRRDAANEMMDCMANLVQAMAGAGVVVRFAHMELAEPSISAGVRSCVEAGATELIVFPYMLSPGKHSTGDIPRLVGQAAAEFPALDVRVTSAFGVHEKLAELILGRAGVPVAQSLTPDEAARCWHSTQSATACGDACRCRPVDLTARTSEAPASRSSRTSAASGVPARGQSDILASMPATRSAP
jgi:sirohydrochlorin ferrochelatase